MECFLVAFLFLLIIINKNTKGNNLFNGRNWGINTDGSLIIDKNDYHPQESSFIYYTKDDPQDLYFYSISFKEGRISSLHLPEEAVKKEELPPALKRFDDLNFFDQEDLSLSDKEYCSNIDRKESQLNKESTPDHEASFLEIHFSYTGDDFKGLQLKGYGESEFQVNFTEKEKIKQITEYALKKGENIVLDFAEKYKNATLSKDSGIKQKPSYKTMLNNSLNLFNNAVGFLEGKGIEYGVKQNRASKSNFNFTS